ncbi:MAG: mandelate racemase/muconate lactonizing enzyme family protein [Geminicoccaceae bacterium]|nr:mandelate racemase/muconate lactonizing enzyme family protein [Geminicoccaceae bacterium]
MKITKVTIYRIDYGASLNVRQGPITIRIDTDEGLYGAGEVGLAYGDAQGGGIGMVQTLAERHLIGADPMRIEAMWDRLYRRSFWGQGGGPVVFGAISAIDEALWDIKGKALGVPVYELLGGRFRDELRCYANGWNVDMSRPEQYAERCLEIVAEGWDALKFDPWERNTQGAFEFPRRHIPRDWAMLGVERVRAVHAAVGDDVDICLDIHGNLGITDAITYGRMLEETRPFFYEEPVDPFDFEGTTKVMENVKIPIAGGERLYTRYQFRPFLERQAIDILQPDVNLTGGITETFKIASMADVWNLHLQPHNCGGPVATAAAVQLDFAIPNFIIQEMFPYWSDGRFDIVEETMESRIEGGRLAAPTAPGLGVLLNDDYLGRFPKIEITG